MKIGVDNTNRSVVNNKIGIGGAWRTVKEIKMGVAGAWRSVWKRAVELIRTFTTKADFDTCTLTDTVATEAGDVELAKDTLNDTFSDPTTSQSIWTVSKQGGSGTQNYIGGECILAPEQNKINSVAIRTNGNYTSVKVRAKLQQDALNSPTKYLDIFLGSGTIVDMDDGGTTKWWHTGLASGYGMILFTEGELISIVKRSGAGVAKTQLYAASAPADWHTQYHDYELQIVDGYVRALVDDVVIANIADAAYPSGDILIAQGEYKNNAGATAYIDSIEAMTAYAQSGAIESPAIDLSPAGAAETSEIEFTTTKPTGTTVTVQTALSTDGGTNWGNWQTATSGAAIPGLTAGDDVSNTKMKWKATLGTNDISATPKLSEVAVKVNEGM